MSAEVRPFRCSNCGYAAPADTAGPSSGLCPRCLSPLSVSIDPASLAPATRDGERMEEILRGWVDAFNGRDLDEMLARMSPSVEFHPLRLGRADRGYRGHAGVCDWFEQLMADGRQHTIEILEFRDAGRNRIIALGKSRLEPDSLPTAFWALDRFSDGLIVAAHHYRTDADILEHGRLPDS